MISYEGIPTMNFIGGIVLIGVAVIALLFVRPGQNGEPRLALMRNWLVGQLVAMAIMIAGIAGFGVLILNWPF
jgi:hypothetical protein